MWSARGVQHGTVVWIAAAGDVHASEARRERIEESFARVQEEADLVLLAGDLTTHGEPEQAAVLADACRGLSIPVCAILGNHNLHEGRADEVAAILRDAGVNMLERAAAFYGSAGPRSASWERRDSSAAFRVRRYRTSASRSCARCTRRRRPR